MILTTKRSYNCGCISEQHGVRWTISEYCKQHTPNYAKKADKIIYLKNKKTGRGYTKSPKGFEYHDLSVANENTQ